MKKKNLWNRLNSVFNWIHLLLALIVGMVCAYLLGTVFGMGVKGYLIGFTLGVAITLGGVSIDF